MTTLATRWWWRTPHVLWLTGLWVLLWGDADLAVALAGSILAVAIVAVYPTRSPLTHTVHPVAALRFAIAVAVDIVRANLILALEVLTPKDRTSPGLVDVSLPSSDPAVVTATTQAVNLAPGTVVVNQPAIDRLRVHALYLRDAAQVADHIRHLARLADNALIPHRPVPPIKDHRSS